MNKYHYLKGTMNKYYNTSPKPVHSRKLKKKPYWEIAINKLPDIVLVPHKTTKTTKKRGRPKGSKNKVRVFVVPEGFNQDNVILAIPQKERASYTRQYLYIDWSLNIKAPITEFMRPKEYVDYIANNYNLAPVCLVKYRPDIKSILVDNKAGPGEISISLEEIKTAYGFKQAQKRKRISD